MGKPQERPFGPQLARPHGGDRQDVLQDFQPVCGLPGTGGQFPDSEFLGGDYDGPRPLSLTKTNTWPPPPAPSTPARRPMPAHPTRTATTRRKRIPLPSPHISQDLPRRAYPHLLPLPPRRRQVTLTEKAGPRPGFATADVREKGNQRDKRHSLPVVTQSELACKTRLK